MFARKHPETAVPAGHPPAYNAVTEALDHHRDLWPTNAGVYRSAQLLTGTYGELKNKVLDDLATFALTAA